MKTLIFTIGMLFCFKLFAISLEQPVADVNDYAILSGELDKNGNPVSNTTLYSNSFTAIKPDALHNLIDLTNMVNTYFYVNSFGDVKIINNETTIFINCDFYGNIEVHGEAKFYDCIKKKLLEETGEDL